MLAANAIVTARGGATSHAAVVSRALDKPCVVGCEDLQVLPDDGVLVLAGRRYREGEIISVDGGTGDVILGDVPRSVPTRNLDDLSQLLVWADQQSGAAVWPEATSALPVEVARRTGAAGIAIVPLTDLLHAAGGLPALLEAIGRYSADPDSPPGVIEEPVTAAVQAALLPLLKEATGLAAHVRIPNLSSARARSWIEKWTALAPHLLQPLGPRRLLAAYAQGAAAAAREAGHVAVTLLIGGITSARELEQFAEIAEPGVAAGGVVQNPAVLADPAALAATGHALWIDLAELVRTTMGQPEELLYIEEQAEAAASPAPQLPALVERLVAELIQAPGRAFPVGARLTSNAVSTATALYDLGIRRFSSSITQAEQLRLVFGQHAVKESRNG